MLVLSLEIVVAMVIGAKTRKGTRGGKGFALEAELQSAETAAANHSFFDSAVVPFDQFIQGFKTFPRAGPRARAP